MKELKYQLEISVSLTTCRFSQGNNLELTCNKEKKNQLRIR